MPRRVFILLAATLVLTSCASPPSEKAIGQRVDKLLSQMTLDEKIDILRGVDQFYIRGCERIGIPKIFLSDGPVGVCSQRRCFGDKAGPSVAYPATIALAASWDRDLAAAFGKAHGRDCRARGVHMILAPGVDIYRAPMCGRNFEYLGEDPFLTSEIVVPYIQALKKQGVMACVKHYCCNNQEWDRYSISSDVDERTMREIYLPAFKAAVQRGGSWGVMAAYNLINGLHATENPHILTDILKKDWGFKGIVVSDWGATHSTGPALMAGLDLNMPGNKYFELDKTKKLLAEGKITLDRINDATARILRGIVSMGFLDRPQEDSSIPLDSSNSEAVATRMAIEGAVLLKNADGILPLLPAKIKTLAVIGPNADPAVIGGGGSSKVAPFKRISLLQGLKKRFGQDVKILHSPGGETSGGGAVLPAGGYKAEFFNNKKLHGAPVLTRTDKEIVFDWGKGSPAPEIEKDSFSARWTASVDLPKGGFYELSLTCDDGGRVYLDGQPVVDFWYDHAVKTKTARKKLNVGKHNIKVEYYDAGADAVVQFSFRRIATEYPEAAKLAARADAVILAVGFNNHTEHEGSDRSFILPDGQDFLIKAMAKANPNTIVVLNAGGNVDMSLWIDKIKGLLMAWYPGQNGGDALAKLIAGDISPSGKLPATFEKKWEDNPCYNSYYETPGHPGHVIYKEGIFVGYRGYDKNNIQPRFPFGFGLSYTSFKYDNMKLKLGSGFVTVEFDMTNTGKMKGAEIAQVYVHDVNSSVPRPPKELKGFDRVELTPGETRKVSFKIPTSSLAFYDVKSKSWKLEPGKFEFLVGASSRDIRLRKTVEIAAP